MIVPALGDQPILHGQTHRTVILLASVILMEMAGLTAPESVQGESFLPILTGQKESIRDSIYYAYYELGEHAVPQHFGVRTKTHKLFYLPATKEWQMFDLQNDPHEMKSVYNDPEYRSERDRLVKQYEDLRRKYDAPEYENGG